MDFILGEVIGMLMEWSYHEEDEYGIKIAAYAHFAVKKMYADIFDENFRQIRKSSRLFIDYGYPNWKEKYEEDLSLVADPED